MDRTRYLAIILVFIGCGLIAGCLFGEEEGEIMLDGEDTALFVQYPSTTSDQILVTVTNTYRKPKTIEISLEGTGPSEMELTISHFEIEVPGEGSSIITLDLESVGFSHETGSSSLLAKTAEGEELDRIGITWESVVQSPEDTLLGHLRGYRLERFQPVDYEGYQGYLTDLSQYGDWSMLFSSPAVEQVVIDCQTISNARNLVAGALSEDAAESMQLESKTDEYLTFGLNQLSAAVLAGVGVPFTDMGFNQEISNRQSCDINGREGYSWTSQIKFSLSWAEIELYGTDLKDTGTIIWNDGCFAYMVTGGPFSTIKHVADSLPAPIPHEGSPGYFYERWEGDGNAITECYPGQQISLEYHVEAAGGYVRKPIELTVVSDIEWATDQTIKTYSQDLDLDDKQLQTIGVTLTVPENPIPRSLFVKAFYEGTQIYETPKDDRFPVYEPVLEVADLHFEQNGNVVASVEVGSIVTAVAELRCRRGYVSGTGRIAVRRDLPGFDDEHVSQGFEYALEEGQTKKIQLSFTADQKTDTGFRGYFAKVEWGTYKSSEMQSRLKVGEQAIHKVELTDVYFEYQGRRETTVPEDSVVMAFGTFRSASAPLLVRSMLIKVRKDLAYCPDEDVATFGPFDLSSDDQVISKGFSFEAKDKTGSGLFCKLRGYYIEVTWDGGSYTMSDGYPPRLTVN